MRRLPWLPLLVALAIALSVALAAALLTGAGRGASLLPERTGPPASVEPEPEGARVLVGAGDIADCGVDGDERTARVVESIAGTVFTTGDNAYERGTLDEFQRCYDPTWGRFLDRTRPVAGNHEYETPGAAGYFAYFGDAAGSPEAPWYAYDLGAWRIYALDTHCAAGGRCEADSAQVAWLRDDLATNPRACVAAYAHLPRYSSGARHGDQPQVQPLWDALIEAGAELMVAGHDHQYERFAPVDASGQPAPDGMRSWVVGTGGKSLYDFGRIHATSEARNDDTFGVLALTLRDGSYDWRFVPVEGGTYTDAGTGECH